MVFKKTLVSIHFGSPRFGYTIKRNSMKFQTFDLKIYLILIL